MEYYNKKNYNLKKTCNNSFKISLFIIICLIIIIIFIIIYTNSQHKTCKKLRSEGFICNSNRDTNKDLQRHKKHAHSLVANAEQMSIDEISLLQNAIGTGAINPQIINNIQNNASNLSSSLSTLSSDIQLLDLSSPTLQESLQIISESINSVALSISKINSM